MMAMELESELPTGCNELDLACATMSGEDFFEHYTKKIKWSDTRDIDEWGPRQQSLNTYDDTMRMVDAVVDKIIDTWCDQLPIFDSGFSGSGGSGLGGEFGKAKRVLVDMMENGVLCNVVSLGMLSKWVRLLRNGFKPSDVPYFTCSGVNSHPFANYEEQCTFTLTRILDRLMVWVLNLERHHHHHHHNSLISTTNRSSGRRRRCGDDDGMEKIGIRVNCGGDSGGGGGGGGFVLNRIGKRERNR